MSKIYTGQRLTVELDSRDPDIVDSGIDLSTATAVTIEFQKPNGGATISAAATAMADPYIATADLTAADNDTAGDWKAQLKVTFGSDIWRGDTVTITIKDQFA